MVRITLSFAPNRISKSSQDNEWEVQKVYSVKYQINSNYNSYMNSITIPMTKVFVGTDNAAANKILCGSLHSFPSYGYEHGTMFLYNQSQNQPNQENASL